jgi:hypothetical protein
MHAENKDTELGLRGLAISIWENEGGASAAIAVEGQDGFDVPAYRLRTVYHALPGARVIIDGRGRLQRSPHRSTNLPAKELLS